MQIVLPFLFCVLIVQLVYCANLFYGHLLPMGSYVAATTDNGLRTSCILAPDQSLCKW